MHGYREGHGQGVARVRKHPPLLFRVSSNTPFPHLSPRHRENRTHNSRLYSLQPRDNSRKDIQESGLYSTSTLGAAALQQQFYVRFSACAMLFVGPNKLVSRCYFWDQLESKFTDPITPYVVYDSFFPFYLSLPRNLQWFWLSILPGQIAGPVSRPLFSFFHWSFLTWDSLGYVQYGTECRLFCLLRLLFPCLLLQTHDTHTYKSKIDKYWRFLEMLCSHIVVWTIIGQLPLQGWYLQVGYCLHHRLPLQAPKGKNIQHNIKEDIQRGDILILSLRVENAVIILRVSKRSRSMFLTPFSCHFQWII